MRTYDLYFFDGKDKLREVVEKNAWRAALCKQIVHSLKSIKEKQQQESFRECYIVSHIYVCILILQSLIKCLLAVVKLKHLVSAKCSHFCFTSQNLLQ